MEDTLVARLKSLKEKSGMTANQIAEKSKIPLSTVTRILSGETQNPTIISVIAITKAMGGTAADIFDDDAQVQPEIAVPQVEANLYKEMIEIYKDTIKAKDKWIKTLFFLLTASMLFILGVVLFDILVGDVGFVRY